MWFCVHVNVGKWTFVVLVAAFLIGVRSIGISYDEVKLIAVILFTLTTLLDTSIVPWKFATRVIVFAVIIWYHIVQVFIGHVLVP